VTSSGEFFFHGGSPLRGSERPTATKDVGRKRTGVDPPELLRLKGGPSVKPVREEDDPDPSRTREGRV